MAKGNSIHPVATPTKSASPSSSPDAAGRRQLTVMFCDLLGSTAMSGRLDPKDMQKVIRTYQRACSGAVARHPRRRRLLSNCEPDRAGGGACWQRLRLGRADELEALIARSGLEPRAITPLLAALLSIPTEERYRSLKMDSAEKKERTIAALIAIFVGLTSWRTRFGLTRRLRTCSAGLSIACRACARWWWSRSARSSSRPGSAGQMWPRSSSTASAGGRRWQSRGRRRRQGASLGASE